MSQETQLAITWLCIGFIAGLTFCAGIHLFDLMVWKPFLDRDSITPATYKGGKKPHTKALGRLFRKKSF